MKKRFSEEQIIGILKEQEAGFAVKDIIRRHGIAEQTFYRCKSKFGGVEVSDAKLAFRTNTKQIANEKGPEHHDRRNKARQPGHK